MSLLGLLDSKEIGYTTLHILMGLQVFFQSKWILPVFHILCPSLPPSLIILSYDVHHAEGLLVSLFHSVYTIFPVLVLQILVRGLFFTVISPGLKFGGSKGKWPALFVGYLSSRISFLPFCFFWWDVKEHILFLPMVVQILSDVLSTEPGVCP